MIKVNWWLKLIEGFWWLTDGQTEICYSRVTFATKQMCYFALSITMSELTPTLYLWSWTLARMLRRTGLCSWETTRARTRWWWWHLGTWSGTSQPLSSTAGSCLSWGQTMIICLCISNLIVGVGTSRFTIKYLVNNSFF